MSSSRGLKIVTLTPGCGYGDAACQYVAGLDALGIPVTWTPVCANSVETIDKAAALACVDGAIRDRLARAWQRKIDDYPFAIRYELVSTLTSRRDGHHFRSAHARWAEADRRHAGELMRSVFERPAGARDVACTLRARLREQFAPAAVCRRLAELMGLSVQP